jgi:dihydroneopterin aldolase
MTRDQILLEGMVFYGYHGVHEEEQRLGQRFVVDLEAACDLQPAAVSDDLALSVSYSDLFRVTRSIVEGTPRALIESVAETIAAAILEQYPAISEVTVTVRKPEAPIKGSVLKAAGVRIRRGRRPATE